MITQDAAARIAQTVAERAMQQPVSIRPELTIVRDFGWVFFYDSVEYVSTQNEAARLYGNAPVIVNRSNGRASLTGTQYPIEDYLAAYEALGPERFEKDDWREFLRHKDNL